MSRIHKILARAERDGTAERLIWPERQGSGPDRTLSIPRAWRAGTTAELPADTLDPLPPAGTDERRPDEPLTERFESAVDTPAVRRTAADPIAPPRQLLGAALDPLLVISHDPLSAGSEQYRTLRTRVTRTDGSRAHKVLAITSPCRGDGKSVTASNLALATAQEFDRRALLVDADLRNARVHQLFGIQRQPGLVDVLTGAVQIDEALVALPGSRLVLLAAGSAHAQPTELLGSSQMRQLLELLRRQFDHIIVDAASAQSSDTGALQSAVDGLLLVVRAGHTPRPAIERAIKAIPSPRLMGLVLNDSRSPDAIVNG
jgi:protein-tyrosine kinase